MSKKTELVTALAAKVEPRWPFPKSPRKEATLLEQGIVLVLMRHMSQSQAEATLTGLQAGYDDWNEARVSQVQELASHFRTGSRKKGTQRLTQQGAAARAVREFLQEVFQKTHGLDLEHWRHDPTTAAKQVTQMPFLGLTAGSYLLWVASDGQLPVHGGLVRLFDRLGLITRTSSIKKGRDQLMALVVPGQELEFLTAFNEVADLWCDARKPLCHRCVLVVECKFGKKAYREWQVQQTRLEAQRKREAERRRVQEKKDADRARREEIRAFKRAEADANRRERELAKKRREADRRKAADAKKKAEARAKGKKASASPRTSTAKTKSAAAGKKGARSEARLARSEKKATSQKPATGAAKGRSSATKGRAKTRTPKGVSRR